MHKEDEKTHVQRNVEEIRHLLSGECVVALDTSILDLLEKESEPDWFAEFVEMNNAGVRFVIPDLCVGERIECFAKARPSCIPSMKLKWRTMVLRLDSIIWQELPCLPLRGDLFDLIGIHERDGVFLRHDPFTISTAKELYKHLHDYEGSRYNAPNYRIPYEDEITRKRSEWVKCILKFRELLKTENKSGLVGSFVIEKEPLLKFILRVQEISFSFRGDDSSVLELPFRYLIERIYDPKYCNPNLGRRTKNDGIDFLILHLTMASINVCSTDHFFKCARSLDVTKSSYCHTPETLLKDWRDGVLFRVDLQK